jgi:hypothetical protein
MRDSTITPSGISHYTYVPHHQFTSLLKRKRCWTHKCKWTVAKWIYAAVWKVTGKALFVTRATAKE